MKLLTYGDLSAEFESHVRETYPDIEVIRPESKEKLRKEIISAKAYAGFNELEGCDLSQLRWIHSFGAGVDAFLGMDDMPERIKLSRSTGQMGRKIGEFCLGYILADLKQLIPTWVNQQQQQWQKLPPANLYDQKVLILGTGSIGQGIAQSLKGLCKTVVGMNRSMRHPEGFDRVLAMQDGDTLKVEHFDVVINALPKTPATTGLLDRAFMSSFQSAHFINIGRGNAIEEEVLLEAMDQGWIRRATLDVFAQEPLPATSKLWVHEQVLITPHISGPTGIEDIIESFARVYPAIQNGEAHELLVNREEGY